MVGHRGVNAVHPSKFLRHEKPSSPARSGAADWLKRRGPMQPDTHYAKSGDVRIAYQVAGDGPFDLVFVPGFISNLDLVWEEPSRARFFSRLASFSRLILFDKRGTGLSDRVSNVASLEERMDDVRAVMDAVGSERAAIFGVSEGGAMSMLFAATYPARTQALVLYGTYGHFPIWVLPPDKFRAFLDVLSATGGPVRLRDSSLRQEQRTRA